MLLPSAIIHEHLQPRRTSKVASIVSMFFQISQILRAANIANYRMAADPTGENGWLDLVDEASRTAGDIEQRIAVMELYKRATSAEPWSKKLWLAYCEFVWSLYTDCQNGDAGWPEDEQLMGQELFSAETAMAAWQEGYQATMYRINDSHEIWNRWISIEQERLSNLPNSEHIDRIRTLFTDRLQLPHSTWEGTFQMFSTFVTKFEDPAVYEERMIRGRAIGRIARELYDVREEREVNLRNVRNMRDRTKCHSFVGTSVEKRILRGALPLMCNC